MKTTRSVMEAVEYLGIDLSDRYAKNRRPNDVCGLTSIGANKLSAAFWLWEWPEREQRLNVSEIAKEIGAAKSTMIDGPQALASTGNILRACERACGAAGKTPDTLPLLGKPFAGFVRSSVELFGALSAAEFLVSPSQFIGGISEVYPGDIWYRLVGRTIPKKSTHEGRRARKLILQALGLIGLPELPTHDQNDACISALMAAAADGKVGGVCVHGIGLPLARDPVGTLREGPIVVPFLSQELRESLHEALRELRAGGESGKVRTEAGKQASAKLTNNERFFVGKNDRTARLLRALRKRRDARICTYAWAYRHLFGEFTSKWSQAYAQRVIALVANVPLSELPTLGEVGLDSFIVRSSTGLPGEGHWKCSAYDREEWERVLGTATVLR